MKRILLIDNYDSFTWNLVHLLYIAGAEKVDVVRNDQVQPGQPDEYDKLVFSPGPGIPEEAGMMCELIRSYADKKPILGVCLGHQAIGEVFGSKLLNLSNVYHGVATDIMHQSDDYLFQGVPEVFKAGRYHSWVIDENQFSPELRITARDKDGWIMAVAHQRYDVRGLQFHPESILTAYSEPIIKNWLNH
ncbi:MAG: aminodeoxychorismate/anthranilate synthase component II [Bacteroidia bacterium]|jgi:anthranilate synthase component 2|nr:aminodeoxychorismate/anthranilate synthase component II [Bacteroidia bacterium]MCC6769335.1 aminodeoxychorismate/anthranilate synthase component II [Bacteroidia bacterium]